MSALQLTHHTPFTPILSFFTPLLLPRESMMIVFHRLLKNISWTYEDCIFPIISLLNSPGWSSDQRLSLGRGFGCTWRIHHYLHSLTDPLLPVPFQYLFFLCSLPHKAAVDAMLGQQHAQNKAIWRESGHWGIPLDYQFIELPHDLTIHIRWQRDRLTSQPCLEPLCPGWYRHLSLLK